MGNGRVSPWHENNPIVKMKFGGIQKTSLIDYPGKMSCVLFVSGCNFRCPYCHNPDLAKGCPEPARCFEDKEALSFLRDRRGFLDGVVISGGEPTAIEALPRFCGKVRQLGYPVKLDTNGSRPGMIRRLLDEGLIDYIAMDIKTDPVEYPEWIQKSCRPEDIRTSARMIIDSGLPHEFRTTCIQPLIKPGVIESIARLIKGAALYAIQQCRDQEMLRPDFVKDHCKRFTNRELSHLKAIADPWVQTCIVR